MLQTTDGISARCLPRTPTQETEPQKSLSPQLSPRSELWDWDFSLRRNVNRIRWDDGEGGQFLCDHISGTCQAIRGIGFNGHVILRAKLDLKEEGGATTAYIWRDPDAPPHEVVEGLVLPSDSFIRMCYHAFGRNFRFRIDGGGGEYARKLFYVDDYLGDVVMSRRDGGRHVHHKGPAILEGKITENHYRTAHFYARL
jgi:hypothetical protein